jgi:hypothetical protein
MSFAAPSAIGSIRQSFAALDEGVPVLARQFLHVASRAAVDQALARLCRSGELLRVGRGAYVRPVHSRFGERPPAPERVAEALAVCRGEQLAPSGAASANTLGLTTQVPTRVVYLTSGRSRRLSVGRQVVELRHAPGWQLLWPQEHGGHVIRALAWLGPKEAAKKAADLDRRLSRADRQRLAEACPRVPSWLARHLGELAHG